MSVNIQTTIRNKKKFKPMYCLKQITVKKENDKKNNPIILIISLFFDNFNHSKLVTKKIKTRKNINGTEP